MFKGFRVGTIAVIASCMVLTACGQQYPTAINNQPVEQQVQSQGYGGGTVAAAALGGAVLGHMMGKSAGRRESNVIVHQVPSRPYYGGYGRRSVTTTTTRRSLGGRTVTRTVTRHR